MRKREQNNISFNFLNDKSLARGLSRVGNVHIIREGTKMKRKKMKKLTAVVVPVLAMSVALTACSGSGGENE